MILNGGAIGILIFVLKNQFVKINFIVVYPVESLINLIGIFI